MLLTLAPMESLTGVVFRRVHHEMFDGADAYYTPFITPTAEPRFTERQMKELTPDANRGIPLVPQLLTRSAPAFIWAARSLASMGYGEVNLNLGCPMGTVTAKGKGSGFLRHTLELEAFLEEVFEADLPIRVSIKTRLGWASEEEFEALARIYSRFPISELIIHARLRSDFYRGEPRVAAFDRFLPSLPMPVGYNGDLTTSSGIREFGAARPRLSSLMVGRSAVANPAIFRAARGGGPASGEELKAFHDALFHGLCEAFGSVGNTVSHMKQYWFYMKSLFSGGEKTFKKILKAKKAAEYESLVEEVFDTTKILPEAGRGWFKPLP